MEAALFFAFFLLTAIVICGAGDLLVAILGLEKIIKIGIYSEKNIALRKRLREESERAEASSSQK